MEEEEEESEVYEPVFHSPTDIAGHRQPILSVAFSPDGQRLASGSRDTFVRVWNTTTMKLLFECQGHVGWVLVIAWSPDGRHLVSGSKDGGLICWNLETGMPLATFTDHKGRISGISWEPLNKHAPCRSFVSAGSDGFARIWDIKLNKCVSSHKHRGAVTCVRWGGEGFIYTGCQDKSIYVWQLDEEQLFLDNYKDFEDWVNSLALNTEYVMRTGAYSELLSPHEMQKVALDKYNKMKASTPERLVVTLCNLAMILWTPSTDEEVKLVPGHSKLVNDVCFSPDGRWIATASYDKTVLLWDSLTGSPVQTFSGKGHVGPVIQLSWSPDSSLFTTAGKDSTVKVWNIHKGLIQDIYGTSFDDHAHRDEVYAVDWSPDGDKVVSGGRDMVLKLWQTLGSSSSS